MTGPVLVDVTTKRIVSPAAGIGLPTGSTIFYDGSNYATITVASNGATTFNATGAGAAFVFSDNVGFADIQCNVIEITGSLDGDGISGTVSLSPDVPGVIDNIVIGSVTPLAGTFTTLSGTTLAISTTSVFTGTVTLGNGSGATAILASNLLGATDPSITFGNALITLSHGLTVSTGVTAFASGSAAAPSLVAGAGNTDGWYAAAGGQFTWAASSQANFNFISTQFRIGANSTIRFGDNNSVVAGTQDLGLSRVSAGVLGVGTGAAGSTAGAISCGTITCGNILMGSGNNLTISSKMTLFCSADGVIRLANAASNSMTRLNFGGETSSFPALQINTGTQTITAGLADGSAGGAFVASGTLSVTGASTLNGNVALGNATTDLIGFYGVTAVDQPAAVADVSAGAVPQTAAGATDCMDKINLILARLRELGIIAT